MAEFEWFIGIDLGSYEHQVCVIDAERRVVDEKVVKHDGASVREWVDEIVEMGKTVAVGLESPHGALVDALLDREIAVFSVNPIQLDRFRDRHTVAGAKDDRRDAFVLADALRTDRTLFRRIELTEPELIELRELSRDCDVLREERLALGSRLRDSLQRYYPQILELGSVYNDRWLWALIERAPSPEKGQKLTRSPIDKILRKHHVRRLTGDQVQEVLRKEALPVASGVVKANVRIVRSVLRRLRLVDEEYRARQKEVAELLGMLRETPEGKTEHRDAEIILSCVGVGNKLGATMLAEAASLLAAGHYSRLRCLNGSAPVTRRSGRGKPRVVRRQACNRRLQNAFFNWARCATRFSPRARRHYERLRSRGHGHARALRGVADRLTAVLVAMLQNRELFDPVRWEGAT